MLIAVFDANTLASGALASGGPSSQLVDRWRLGQFQLVLSDWILDELARAFTTRYLAQRLPADVVRGYLDLLRTAATIVERKVTVRGIATHPEDDEILATALSGQADFLVTGDKKLQRLERYRGVTILSPRAFLNLL